MAIRLAQDRVDSGYDHVSKLVQSGQPLVAGDAFLKWYDIAPADAPVPSAIRELARESLEDALRSGEIELTAECGFVILHRCGEAFYFLLVSTWRNNNELWETVWAKNGENDPAFRPWPIETAHRPTFCVWELGAVAHEQGAWGEFLRSARDDAAKQTYLDSSFEGEV